MINKKGDKKGDKRKQKGDKTDTMTHKKGDKTGDKERMKGDKADTVTNKKGDQGRQAKRKADTLSGCREPDHKHPAWETMKRTGRQMKKKWGNK